MYLLFVGVNWFEGKDKYLGILLFRMIFDIGELEN